ncbi:MAG: NRAMP family divalent metal transporter [Flavobacteriaceae bacterium]
MQNLKAIGPGLIFASTAIGTSHLVLSTRAGAHHGILFLGIILLALILKYPLYEFGPRFANATGYSLLKGYKDQGKWAIWLFMLVIFISMFAVTGAISALSAGLLASFTKISIPVPWLSGIILLITTILLLIGGFMGLDVIIKIIAIVLVFTVAIAFMAVWNKGPVPPIKDFQPPSIWEGAGLTLLISLLGWMPAGMEASTMNSIWTEVKIRQSGYHPTLRETLFDFRLGYVFTTVLALMFLIIGAFTVYGSGELLEGSAMVFSKKLIAVFTSNLGQWSYYIIAIAAFTTIYGTLLSILDAFPRSFVRGLRVMVFDTPSKNEEQLGFLKKWYGIVLPVTAIGGFVLFYFSSAGMVKTLEMATILSFVLAPIIGYLNLRCVLSPNFPKTHRPPTYLIALAYIGLICMMAFAIYYLISLLG